MRSPPEPSEWRMHDLMPPPLAAGPRTTAPAPSPKTTQVPRSLKLMILVRVSAPITRAWRACPLLTKRSAMLMAYRNPVQAACTSKAGPCAPSCCWTREAPDGKNESGVEVPSTIRSVSSGRRPAAPSAFWAAATARSVVVSVGAAMRRSWIPVRSRIQVSDVSTIFSRSKLVRTPSGTKVPTDLMLLCMKGLAPTSRPESSIVYTGQTAVVTVCDRFETASARCLSRSRSGVLCSHRGDRHAHPAFAWAVEVGQENSLPASELQPVGAHRDGLRCPDQAGLDVGGGVAFGVPVAPFPGHQPLQRGEQVVQDIRVRILIDEDARGGMRDVDGAHAVADAGFRHQPLHQLRDIDGIGL